MKHTHSKSMTALAIAILFSYSLATGFSVEPVGNTLMDFSDPLVGTQWLSVNDGVMGGVSEGRVRITKDKTLEFFGTLSLENRGGFTSIRTRPADLQLDGYDSVAVRAKGDGRTYNLNLRTSSRSAAGSYRAAFKTKKNTWQVVRIAFKDFTYTAYGRRLAGIGAIQANKIQSVGFTLADKKAGPFRLEVDWIRAEKAGSASNGVIHVIDTVLMPPSRTQTAQQAALDVIQLAIQRGVPLFNAGQPGACAAIYEVAVESLLKSSVDALTDKDRSTLSKALRDMRQDQDPGEQAWTLRRALDNVYRSLS